MKEKIVFKKIVLYNLVVIFFYILSGFLGLMLAVPPGYATTIWASSGIALGSVLVWNLRTLPGIFIASFILNCYITFNNVGDLFDFSKLFPGLITGAGALLQALFGWWLVKRFVRLNNPLHLPKDILIFALLTGPVSCVIAATISNVGLYWLGVISSENLSLSWITWWIGDSIGVLIFTPVFLILFAKPRKLWRSRIIPILVPLCLTFIIVIIAHVFYRYSEFKHIQSKFAGAIQYKFNLLTEKLKLTKETAHTTSLFLAAAPIINKEEFQRLGTLLLQENSIIQSIQWVPKVTNRENFEKKYHLEILGKNSKNYSSSKKKSVYYPILFTVSKSHNIFPNGYDLSSNPNLINRLNDTPVLLGSKGKIDKMLIISPVYRSNQIAGFTILQINFVQLFNQFFDNFLNYSNLMIKISSPDLNSPIFEIYNKTMRYNPDESYSISYTKYFADSAWNITATLSPYFSLSRFPWHAWLALTTTLFFCVLMNIILFILYGQRYLIQYLAYAKTMQLKTEKAKNLLLLNAAGEGIFRIDINYKITFINPAAKKLLGYSSNELKNESIIKILCEKITPPNKIESTSIYKAIQEQTIIRAKEAVFWKKDHSYLSVEYTCIPVIINHKVIGAAIIFSDITERLDNEKKLIKMAHYDPLTKLPNRQSFFDYLEHALGRACRNKTQLGLCFIDIDNFKVINDTFGHAYGDKLLMALSEIITPYLREIDYFARIGGDEFGLIFEQIHQHDDLIKIFERILSAFHNPIQIDDLFIKASISIGVAMYPKHGSDTQTLFVNADIAMYHAKAQGKATYSFFR
ncbi:diguanylate cyclase domain-containing protein [Legionella cincinnatiensis]|uniref:Sensory box/GGDEF domain protein n=1 Tax=Legionella cincinnatiensis TaxID=28085 RepID=A0A378IKC2_9GAMM|nr:diguanylate cyclase [Legionella cincinnatiensis]KTC83440.1 sensory box/GGDEF domain protein [Legionella cincinnatiensis]STX35526.1 sensory box/GGDEF domain protein [Legionella cincinnatiensis]